VKISGHAGTVPGAGVERAEQVCKLVDTTTCIGCKACEVACLEWNGYQFADTTFDNTYQTMPQTAWNYWNLIKFNEHEREDGTLQLLMRKRPVHALRRPGLPGGLSGRRRDRSICQRHRRFPATELYRLRLLRERMSF
jgi:ferredoxin